MLARSKTNKQNKKVRPPRDSAAFTLLETSLYSKSGEIMVAVMFVGRVGGKEQLLGVGVCGEPVSRVSSPTESPLYPAGELRSSF